MANNHPGYVRHNNDCRIEGKKKCGGYFLCQKCKRYFGHCLIAMSTTEIVCEQCGGDPQPTADLRPATHKAARGEGSYRCSVCKLIGHNAATCPQRSCGVCGMKGHPASACDARLEQTGGET